jgi:hypothetical protein
LISAQAVNYLIDFMMRGRKKFNIKNRGGIMTIKDQCREYDLEAPAGFWKSSEEELGYIYNGAGPDWLPAWGRAVLSKFLAIFALAFYIHDYEFEYSDHSREGFDTANSRMLKNMIKILDIEYPFWSVFLWPVRVRWWFRARLAYRSCNQFGWSAWVD